MCASPKTAVYSILRALSPRREEWSAVCDVCLMFYFSIDFCHINQSAGPVRLTYSAIPIALTRPQTIYWGGGGGELAIFAAQPLLLPASWRQLIIPSLNPIHFLCAKPSRCVLLLVWGGTRLSYTTPHNPTRKTSQSLWKISRSIHLLMLS